MTPDERWSHLNALDVEMLKGGVILSEWCTFIARDADTAFAAGAHIVCIVLSTSGLETYLRSECVTGSRQRLVALINGSPITADLKTEIHTLRKFRNKWVHIDDPWMDDELLENPEAIEEELEKMACFAVRTLRKTIYENQWV
jgi:hypothetical protein